MPTAAACRRQCALPAPLPTWQTRPQMGAHRRAVMQKGKPTRPLSRRWRLRWRERQCITAWVRARGLSHWLPRQRGTKMSELGNMQEWSGSVMKGESQGTGGNGERRSVRVGVVKVDKAGQNIVHAGSQFSTAAGMARANKARASSSEAGEQRHSGLQAHRGQAGDKLQASTRGCWETASVNGWAMSQWGINRKREGKGYWRRSVSRGWWRSSRRRVSSMTAAISWSLCRGGSVSLYGMAGRAKCRAARPSCGPCSRPRAAGKMGVRGVEASVQEASSSNAMERAAATTCGTITVQQ